MIKAITYLHQHQLVVLKDDNGVEYVETKLVHIEWANKLCRESLLRKSDQLSGAQRTFFEKLKVHLQSTNSETFFTKDIAQEFNLYRQQVKRNLHSLEDANLILKVGTNNKTSFEYKVVNWEDYTRINQGINALDEMLIELKEKYPNA